MAGGGVATIERRGQAREPGSPGVWSRVAHRPKAGKASVSEMGGGGGPQ
jgi:hypothetical protein